MDTAGGLTAWSAYVHDDSRPTLEKHWNQILHTGLSTSFELKMKAPHHLPDVTGAELGLPERWLLVTATPEVDDNGIVKRVFGTNTDISNAKRVSEFTQQRLNDVLEAKRQSEVCYSIPTFAILPQVLFTDCLQNFIGRRLRPILCSC